MRKSLLKRFSIFLLAFAMVVSLFNAFPVTVKAAGVTYYVDSVNGNDTLDGKSQTVSGTNGPWKSLTKVNSTTFEPGDKILFKAGGLWSGQLYPLGSGDSVSPIIIDMYGTGNKPVINGQGTVTATFYLYNQQYWEVNNLELTNDNDFNTDSTTTSRMGVHIKATDFGTVNHIYLKNLFIHDIDGQHSTKDNGGILVEVKGGGSVVTKYNDVLIENCTIRKVDRTGIQVKSDWKNHANLNSGVGAWTGATNIVIRNNSLDDIGGDGILTRETAGALVEYNVCKDANKRAGDYNAGMWPWNANDTVFQYNEAYLTRTTKDGQGFDCDYFCKNTIFQYNYSHDNEGGFMLIMGITPNDNNTVRYNISQNDSVRLFSFAGQAPTGFKAYNNTLYIPSTKNVKIVDENNGTSGTSIAAASFYNNIFYNLSSGSSYFLTGGTWSNNCFYNPNGVPADQPEDSYAVTADPKLVNAGSGGTGTNMKDPNRLSGYKLQSDSPCINAGKTISNNGGKDFWGNTLYSGNPDIGVHEFTSGITETPVTSAYSYTASADAYIRSGAYAGTNYGTTTDLMVKNAVQYTDNKRIAYIKFDYTKQTEAIDSAKLKITTAGGYGHNIHVYGLNNDTWTETGITWNNAPNNNTTGYGITGTGVTDIATVKNDTAGILEIDVTSYIMGQSDKVVTFAVITDTVDEINTNNLYSKEASSGKPVLEIQNVPIINDNFNSMTTGSAPSGWTLDAGSGTVTVEAVPSTTDKSVKMNRTGTSPGTRTSAYKTFANTNGIITVEAKIMRSGSTANYFCLPYIYDSNGNRPISIAFDNGNIKAYNGSTLQTVQAFAADTWYTLKIVMNTDTDKFDLYVDGVSKLSQASFRTAVSDISKIEFYSADNSTGVVYFDNVKIYK